jgi:hypothetical protein
MAQARDKYSRIQYPVYVRPQVPRLVIFSSLRSQDVITRAGEYPHYSRTMQDNKVCSTAEATGLARIMFVRYGHVPFGLNGDLSGPLTELSKFDEWDKTTRGKVSYIRKLVQGHAWDSSSWIKKRIGGEVSQDGCLTLITNWDLHRRIFLLVPPGENDDQRIAREAEVTEYETGIVTLQGLVKASHRYHWRTTSDKATLAKTTAQRTKLEADREFYAARKDGEC